MAPGRGLGCHSVALRGLVTKQHGDADGALGADVTLELFEVQPAVRAHRVARLVACETSIGSGRTWAAFSLLPYVANRLLVSALAAAIE